MGIHRHNDDLNSFIPDLAKEQVKKLSDDFRFRFIPAFNRKSRLGYFKPSVNGKPHNISVNCNLNKYAFLITFLHELAHLVVYEKHGKRTKPHGQEWKSIYGSLLKDSIALGVFPDDITETLKNSVKNIKASSSSDTQLTKTLEHYNEEKDMDSQYFLDEIPENTVFKIYDGRVFKKGNKLRKRIRCLDLKTKKIYLFNPVAKVTPLEVELFHADF